MPSHPVEQQNGMRSLGDVARDFVDLKLHHVGIGIGRRQRRAPPRWADRAEQIGVVVALVGGAPWPPPRLAHWRTRPFFWPIRASSLHDTFSCQDRIERSLRWSRNGSRGGLLDWGSSYPQRALHNLTYGPIAGRGTLDRNHNASCTRLRSPADATHLTTSVDDASSGGSSRWRRPAMKASSPVPSPASRR
jgi:hypothetical protein